MNIYVVEDDWEAGTTDVLDFGRDRRSALAHLEMRERELFPWTGPKRVCYFRADSLDTLRYTHSNWFHDNVTVRLAQA